MTIALFVLSWFLAPGTLSGSAIDSLLPYAGILAIAAIGQTIVVMLKGIDLSLPGMMTLGALVSSKYANDHGSILIALVLVAVIAVVVGAVNGFVVSAFSVSPLVATLAMNAVLLGAALAYSGGTPTRVPDDVARFSLEKSLGVSHTVWLALLLMVVMMFATGRTTWGRRIISVGANERAARVAGVRTSGIKISGYSAAALCYAGAGVLLAGYVSTPNTDAGNSYLLPAIAAVVVGGTALTGGRGNILGTAVGALFLSQLTQLVFSLGAPSSTQYLVQAAVIAVAVAVQQQDVGRLIQTLRGKQSA
ncbi:ABC transporter permease [Gordonia sp. PKS22-38]|uniref:ABC transporter permease n=1 Tax=Gordonia prachuapensis TaxID=3115651 RepID=A0ABU7MSS8_9ACTN|nr:ABC transporter permease [Gordonia sp. PKS22-38]